jgi:hypothetical protein
VKLFNAVSDVVWACLIMVLMLLGFIVAMMVVWAFVLPVVIVRELFGVKNHDR